MSQQEQSVKQNNRQRTWVKYCKLDRSSSWVVVGFCEVLPTAALKSLEAVSCVYGPDVLSMNGIPQCVIQASFRFFKQHSEADK